MSIFDALFGRKTPELKTIPQWEDTAPPVLEIHPDANFEPVALAAAWPFPSAASHPEPIVETETKPLVVNTAKLAQHHAALAEERKALKQYLKEIVQSASEHGIEFVHVGTTTFAWRYATSAEEGYVRNKRVIHISTAVCNPADQFAKWHGSAIAAENMLDGKFITLRIDSGYKSPRDAINTMGLVTWTSEQMHEALDQIAAKKAELSKGWN
jgi:hypothetical protein